MTYDYTCTSCENHWEESHPIIKRDVPCGKPCPHCGKEGTVQKSISIVPLSYAGVKSTLDRAGSDWNDVLKNIKSKAGPKSTIQTK